MGVYSLVAEQGDREGKAIRVVADLFMLSAEKKLTTNDIVVTGQDDDDVKQSAKRGAWIAFQELRRRDVVHPNSEIPRSGVIFEFDGDPINQVKGPSAGLCFLVKMARVIIEDFLRLAGKEIPVWDCAATGILTNFISIAEEVERVEAIEAKIKAALASLGREGVVFYPRANDPLNPALRQEAEQKQITLVAVDTPRQAIDLLLKEYGISSGRLPNGKPPAYPPVAERLTLKDFLRDIVVLLLLGWILFGPTILPSSPLPTVLQPVPVPSFEAALFYEEEKSGVVRLPEGKVLTQGDGFRVRLEVDRDCSLYVLEVDSENHITWFFPPAPYSQPLPRGEYWIPKDEEKPWAELDDVKGEELVLVWTTTKPSFWLEAMRESIRSSKDLTASERRELRNKLVEYLERGQRERGGTLKRLPFPHG